MEKNCFFVDSNGTEIVQFDAPTVDRSYLLVLHRVITIFMCSLGFIANFLLISIILVNSGSLSNFRGIVLFPAVLETLYCSITFLSMPMPYITHGRLLTFANNGFHFSSRFFNSTIITAASVSTITCWSFATYMFLYRLHLVKNRTPPKSLYFFLYASVPICSFFLYSFSVVKGMSLFETLNPRTIENRVLILKQMGFQLNKTEIFEVNNKVPPHIHAIFAITMLINYLIIVFCVVQIRRILRSGPTISTTTRRLNRAMDRVLMFNAFFPILSYIFPSAYTGWAINSCADFPWFGFLYSILMNLSFICCPISTALFIRPYRRTAMRWLRLDKRRRSSVFKINGTLSEMKLQRNPIPHFSLSPIS